MGLNRNLDLTGKAQPLFVEGVLNYLAPTNERPRTYTNDQPPGEPRTTVVSESHVVPIRNLRPVASAVSLDREGFSLVHHDTAVTDFYDDDEVKSVYYPEVETALEDATDADRVFIFDHTTRRHIPGVEDIRTGVRQPVARVHVDHTAKSGPQRVRDLLPDEADDLLRGRVQVINLWRPIRGPLRDSPLAVCDARILYPFHLRNIAVNRLVEARWTDAIHDEWIRNLTANVRLGLCARRAGAAARGCDRPSCRTRSRGRA